MLLDPYSGNPTDSRAIKESLWAHQVNFGDQRSKSRQKNPKQICSFEKKEHVWIERQIILSWAWTQFAVLLNLKLF